MRTSNFIWTLDPAPQHDIMVSCVWDGEKLKDILLKDPETGEEKSARELAKRLFRQTSRVITNKKTKWKDMNFQ